MHDSRIKVEFYLEMRAQVYKRRNDRFNVIEKIIIRARKLKRQMPNLFMKGMSADNRVKIEETEDRQAELMTGQQGVEVTDTPKKTDNLEFRHKTRITPFKISVILLVSGVLSFVFSFVNDSQVLAFIGLGLTFWGALFLFVRPTVYVRSSLLEASVISTYVTVDRITKDMKSKVRGYYIPPYPAEIYLPEHMKGLKDMVVFVSADTHNAVMPSLEKIASGMFQVEKPKGILLSPPGLGILNQFEREMSASRLSIAKPAITNLEPDDLYEILPRIIVEDLQLAKELDMKLEKGRVQLRIFDSVFKRLYADKTLKSVHLLGCPLVSALACSIAKNTGKPVSVHKDLVSPDNQTILVWLNIVESD